MLLMSSQYRTVRMRHKDRDELQFPRVIQGGCQSEIDCRLPKEKNSKHFRSSASVHCFLRLNRNKSRSGQTPWIWFRKQWIRVVSVIAK